MGAVVLDSGFVIQLQKRKRPALDFVALAAETRTTLKVPSITLLEWCKSVDAAREILTQMTVVPIDAQIAAAYATARAQLPPSVSDVDVVVMATAALAGDAVVTTDFSDLDLVRTRAGFDVQVRTLADVPKLQKTAPSTRTRK